MVEDPRTQESQMKYGGSALNKDVVEALEVRLREIKPLNILEFGSGTSTYFLAKYADEYGAKVTSLENVGHWFVQTQELCKEFKSLDLRLTPLVNSMYSTDLPDDVDFVLIDGPPGWSGKGYFGRRKTFPSVWPHLSDNFEVWLDDANRDHELGCLASWSEDYPIDVRLNTDGKGLAIIRRA